MLKHLKFILIILTIFISCETTFAENYFISNSGNDQNEGNSPVRPWRTIDKLNSFMRFLKPGDGVYFERGGYYSGQINLKASGDKNLPLVFGAYGEGNNPVISGAMAVKGWELHKKNVYKIEMDFAVKNFFVNGDQMTLARYPNSGLLTIQNHLSNKHSGFVDKNLKQPQNYWKGSIARIRSENWAYEYSEIKSFQNGAILLTRPTYYPLLKNWGYYLDNNLNELDTLKEWYFEESGSRKGTIYYFSKDNPDKQNFVYEASVYNFGIYSDLELENIVIRDIDFKKQAVDGLYFIGKVSNIEIGNCTFLNQNMTGINFPRNSAYCKIKYNRFYNINGKGIYLFNSRNALISDNIFKDIGMIPGYGTTGDAFGMSALVFLQSDSNLILKNYVCNVGHDGIIYTGRGNTIEKNFLFNVLIYLNDGGALKCYGKNTKYSVWKNNFIFDVIGNSEGVPDLWKDLKAHGIYLDAYSNYNEISSNTILNTSESGINLYDGCIGNVFNNNVCYGNKIGIKFFQEEILMTGNKVNENIFVGLKENQYSVFLRSNIKQLIPVIFNKNVHFNPYNDDIFIYQTKGLIMSYNLNGWKKIIGDYDTGIEVINNEHDQFSKLFMNPSDDTLSILLYTGQEFEEFNGIKKYGSISISPWSSIVLLTNHNTEKSPVINFFKHPVLFNGLNSKSTPQWFCMTAENVIEGIDVTAPDGFEISFNHNDGYSKNIKKFPENVKLNEIIFVKFTPESNKLYYDFITVKSGSLMYKIKVTGKLL